MLGAGGIYVMGFIAFFGTIRTIGKDGVTLQEQAKAVYMMVSGLFCTSMAPLLENALDRRGPPTQGMTPFPLYKMDRKVPRGS